MTDWITSGTWDLGKLEKERLEAALKLVKGRMILDAGCRDGTFSLTLAKENPELDVWGVDTEASSLDWANGKAKELGIDERAMYLNWDITRMEDCPFKIKFDSIFLMETLEHIPPELAAKAYDNILALLKPEGRLIVSVPANTHISDHDHKAIFHREFIHGRVEWMRWIEGVPFLWLAYYVDRQTNPRNLLSPTPSTKVQ